MRKRITIENNAASLSSALSNHVYPLNKVQQIREDFSDGYEGTVDGMSFKLRRVEQIWETGTIQRGDIWILGNLISKDKQTVEIEMKTSASVVFNSFMAIWIGLSCAGVIKATIDFLRRGVQLMDFIPVVMLMIGVVMYTGLHLLAVKQFTQYLHSLRGEHV